MNQRPYCTPELRAAIRQWAQGATLLVTEWWELNDIVEIGEYPIYKDETTRPAVDGGRSGEKEKEP